MFWTLPSNRINEHLWLRFQNLDITIEIMIESHLSDFDTMWSKHLQNIDVEDHIRSLPYHFWAHVVYFFKFRMSLSCSNSQRLDIHLLLCGCLLTPYGSTSRLHLARVCVPGRVSPRWQADTGKHETSPFKSWFTSDLQGKKYCIFRSSSYIDGSCIDDVGSSTNLVLLEAGFDDLAWTIFNTFSFLGIVSDDLYQEMSVRLHQRHRLRTTYGTAFGMRGWMLVAGVRL